MRYRLSEEEPQQRVWEGQHVVVWREKHPKDAPYKCYVYGTQQACWVDIIDGNRGRWDKRMGDTVYASLPVDCCPVCPLKGRERLDNVNKGLDVSASTNSQI